MMLMKRIAPAGAALMLAAAAIHAAAETETPFFSGADLFTGRDLAQEADLSEADYETLADGQDIYIDGGILTIQAGDEGVQASSVVQIDDGTLTIQAKEGIRGTSVQLNSGAVTVNGQLISPRTSDGGREGGNP